MSITSSTIPLFQPSISLGPPLHPLVTSIPVPSPQPEATIPHLLLHVTSILTTSPPLPPKQSISMDAPPLEASILAYTQHTALASIVPIIESIVPPPFLERTSHATRLHTRHRAPCIHRVLSPLIPSYSIAHVEHTSQCIEIEASQIAQMNPTNMIIYHKKKYFIM